MGVVFLFAGRSGCSCLICFAQCKCDANPGFDPFHKWYGQVLGLASWLALPELMISCSMDIASRCAIRRTQGSANR